MKTHITGIDLWAAKLAKQLADLTGWRRSEIYAAAIAQRRAGFKSESVERAFLMLAEFKRDHEDFQACARRMAEIGQQVLDEQKERADK